MIDMSAIDLFLWDVLTPTALALQVVSSSSGRADVSADFLHHHAATQVTRLHYQCVNSTPISAFCYIMPGTESNRLTEALAYGPSNLSGKFCWQESNLRPWHPKCHVPRQRGLQQCYVVSVGIPRIVLMPRSWLIVSANSSWLASMISPIVPNRSYRVCIFDFPTP